MEAAREGKFRIYAVGNIDEGIEILTGIPAGERVDGAYPEGTINFMVERRMKEYAEKLKGFGKQEGKDGA